MEGKLAFFIGAMGYTDCKNAHEVKDSIKLGSVLVLIGVRIIETQRVEADHNT